MQRWHRWEGASDINKIQHKQNGAKDKGRMEGLVSQASGGWLGWDLWERSYFGNRPRRRPPSSCFCTCSVTFSLHQVPICSYLAICSFLATLPNKLSPSLDNSIGNALIFLYILFNGNRKGGLKIISNTCYFLHSTLVYQF